MRHVLIGILWLLLAAPAWAAESPSAQTTDDVTIPVDQLELMVKPLTRSELEPEVEAWYVLVREKAGAISAAQRSVKKTKEAMAEAEEDHGAARQALEEASRAKAEAEEAITEPEQRPSGAKAEGAPPPAAAPEAIEEQAAEQKDRALDDLAALQAEQTALIDRFQVVLDSFAEKGGDIAEYEQYLAALTAVEVDPSGWEESWAAIRGWMSSEEGGIRLAWRIVAFLAILAVTWVIARGVGRLTQRWLDRSSALSELARNLVGRTIRNVLLALGFLVAVASLGVKVTPLLAALGAAGLVLGLALQGTLSNFASGLMILIYRPFDVGDVVEAGGVTGKVSEMNLVSTTFLTFDNQTIIVPNNAIWGNVITNVTANDVRRVDLTFGVAYDTDLDLVEQVLRKAVEEHSLVLDDPEPTIKLQELGDSSVVFICRPWAKTEDYWTVYWDLMRTVKQRFDAEGISIPFPQREIHVRHEAPPPERSPDGGQAEGG